MEVNYNKMAKKEKMKTPDWILEGYDSKADWQRAHGIKSEDKKGKAFKIRECPKCHSNDVGIVLSNMDSEEESNTGKQWECHKCGWKGTDINEKGLTEEELMKLGEEKEK